MADEEKNVALEEEEEEFDDAPDDGQSEGVPDTTAGDGAKKKKKRKKKKKKKSGEDNEVNAEANKDEATASSGPKQIKPAPAKPNLNKLLETIKMLERPTPPPEKPPEERDYKFWKTQPVPQYGEDNKTLLGALEPDKDVSEIRQTPLKLPAGFEWSTVQVSTQEGLDELYTLLSENYVEDDDNMFRFDYSREFLKWALQPPGWKAVWHCGVRNSKNNKLLAFISAIPATMRMKQHTQLLVEINFLCVHKKLRSHRLAPVLIREITRRVNLEGTFQAVYTAGVVLPKPVAKCRYWHRSLDPKKLIDVRFSYLPRNTTMGKLIRSLRLPTDVATPGLRKMTKEDVPGACKITKEYLARFKLAPVFDEEDFSHWLVPREGVIDSFVVEDAETKEITDLISFYTLPSTIVNHPKHKLLKAAYSFYNVTTKTPLKQLMNDALILAKHKLSFDVFNCLDLMDNKEYLQELQFGAGDGHLHYYLYNYVLEEKEAKSEEIGLVLL